MMYTYLYLDARMFYQFSFNIRFKFNYVYFLTCLNYKSRDELLIAIVSRSVEHVSDQLMSDAEGTKRIRVHADASPVIDVTLVFSLLDQFSYKQPDSRHLCETRMIREILSCR
jgi:hypothetical protein